MNGKRKGRRESEGEARECPRGDHNGVKAGQFDRGVDQVMWVNVKGWRFHQRARLCMSEAGERRNTLAGVCQHQIHQDQSSFVRSMIALMALLVSFDFFFTMRAMFGLGQLVA